jgi:hypothetical protein
MSMINVPLWFSEELVRMTMQEAQHQAEIDRLLRQARLVRPGRFSRQARRLLHQLGHGLAALGERLQRRVPYPLGSLAEHGTPDVCRESCA